MKSKNANILDELKQLELKKFIILFIAAMVAVLKIIPQSINAVTNAKELETEKNKQLAILKIRKKFGKNAILTGLNFRDGATTRERNAQVGGHKA